MKGVARLFAAVAVLVIGSESGAFAADEVDSEDTSRFSYGPKGPQFESIDGNNFLWFGVRLQTRFSSSTIRQDELPGQPTDTQSSFAVNRGRLKLGGHLFAPKFTVYSEYDFMSDILLDLRATFAFSDWLSIRVGQWKSNYNRERIDSSGKQQFAERSGVTPWFTVDRQKGLMASGRIAKGKPYDSSYWLGRLSGTGRGGDFSDADKLWLARYQWNFMGRELGFSQSDIDRRKDPAGSVAVAYVDGASRFTRFSSAGGGQLPGYVDGEPGQYAIRQWLFETAWQAYGFSWQQELHWKRITDRITGAERELFGGYLQAGMFFSEVWSFVPEPLELAVRYDNIDLDRDRSGDREREFTVAANWFFNGHRNKLTTDVSYVNRRLAPETDTNIRIRLQWEWSF